MGHRHFERNWTRDWIAVAALTVAVDYGLSYAKLAPLFRVSRSAIAGAIRRHICGKGDPRDARHGTDKSVP